jgi:hypothetical protein
VLSWALRESELWKLNESVIKFRRQERCGKRIT